jgi:hypothetical protein
VLQPTKSRVGAPSREWRGEDQDHPSEEDRWQRSRDLANSEVRKVRAQRLGAPSREWRSHEERRQLIQRTGGPLDQEPHRLSHTFGGSEVERSHLRLHE